MKMDLKKPIVLMLTVSLLMMSIIVPASTESAPKVSDAPNGILSPNAITWQGHTYLVVDNALSWKKAKAACERVYGHLVTITSKKENAFVTSLAKKGSKHLYWIGLNRATVKKPWKWITGEKFKYSNWDVGEPTGSQGNELVVELYGKNYTGGKKPTKAGTWNDAPMDNSADKITWYAGKHIGYICEWDYTPDYLPIDSAIFPDSAFRKYIKSKIDKDKDGYLSKKELAIKSIDCSGKGIKDLTGIALFKNLKTLKCARNKLSLLDVSNNTQLETLDCSNNQLTSLTLPKPGPNNLYCHNNKLCKLVLTVWWFYFYYAISKEYLFCG